MRILVPGEIKPTVAQVTCDRCRCVFEYDPQTEARPPPDPRDIGLHVVQCPTCHKDMYWNY